MRSPHYSTAVVRLLLGGAIVACNHSEAVPADGATDAMTTCDSTCLSQSWWLGRSSDCSVVCMANPAWAECMHADCEVIEATRYITGTRTSLSPMLYSSEAHSFYLIGSPTTKAYTVDGECNLQIGSASPEHFACDGSELQLPTATLQLATPQQAAALDGATVPGRYSY